MKPRSPLAPVILKMSSEGATGRQIAKHLGCSPAYVSKTLDYYGSQRLVVASLPIGFGKWLAIEAHKSGVTPGVMARAMLVDAIEGEMYKCKSTTP